MTAHNDSSKSDLQLRRLSLFSSGVGFFEHRGEVSGNKELVLPFNKNAVNDALKSLVISDPDASPTVSYHSEDTLERTLKGLSADLHGKVHVAKLLESLKGAEIEVFTPTPIKGKIMLVEYRTGVGKNGNNDKIKAKSAYVTLFTNEGARIISLKEISGFMFSDPKIQEDINRALELILQSRDSDARNLTVKLPGEKTRNVYLSYVIPTPIWKISYRLDLSQENTFLQGWAIVDNNSDIDWNEVELALVNGRPVSFTQNLYAPYHLERPVLPLSIAGIARASTYDSGIAFSKDVPRRSRASSSHGSGGDVLSQSEMDALLCQLSSDDSDDGYEAAETTLGSGLIETAEGRTAGDQFEFTIKTPVSLKRRQSAMLPLVEGSVPVEKMLIFSGDKTNIHFDSDYLKKMTSRPINPAVGAELVNNTGMKLPAGPITIYDAGTYAGDALIAFLPEDVKRIITYGEDLTVTGTISVSTHYTMQSVIVSNGFMFFNKQKTHRYQYVFINASGVAKRLIVEHPMRTYGASELIAPLEYKEKTHKAYRFEVELPSDETTFNVTMLECFVEQIALHQSNVNNFASYVSNDEIPEKVRKCFEHAIGLLEKVDEETAKLRQLENELSSITKDQERIRKNLAAAGPETQQGQNYLNKLVAQDDQIDALHIAIKAANDAEKAAKKTYSDYLCEICFGKE